MKPLRTMEVYANSGAEAWTKIETRIKDEYGVPFDVELKYSMKSIVETPKEGDHYYSFNLTPVEPGNHIRVIGGVSTPPPLDLTKVSMMDLVMEMDRRVTEAKMALRLTT